MPCIVILYNYNSFIEIKKLTLELAFKKDRVVPYTVKTVSGPGPDRNNPAVFLCAAISGLGRIWPPHITPDLCKCSKHITATVVLTFQLMLSNNFSKLS